jgi:simple sugar transport system ATP-binding protein
MSAPLLDVRGVHKRFGSVHALRGVNFTVYDREVVALVGDNGAGKSTLIKTIAGTIQPDEGEIVFDGRPYEIDSPRAAREHGIEVVHQDLALAPDLDPATNLYLGRELLRPGLLGRLGFLDKRGMHEHGERLFRELGVKIQDLSSPVGTMSGGQQQGTAVARAVTWAGRLVLLDEPTAALGVEQTGNVLDLIRRVRDNGLSVVLISHNLPEVLEVSDRIEVLRMGQRVARFETKQCSLENVVGAMTGALVHHDAN